MHHIHRTYAKVKSVTATIIDVNYHLHTLHKMSPSSMQLWLIRNHHRCLIHKDFDDFHTQLDRHKHHLCKTGGISGAVRVDSNAYEV